jgi:hypothetical protein
MVRGSRPVSRQTTSVVTSCTPSRNLWKTEIKASATQSGTPARRNASCATSSGRGTNSIGRPTTAVSVSAISVIGDGLRAGEEVCLLLETISRKDGHGNRGHVSGVDPSHPGPSAGANS